MNFAFGIGVINAVGEYGLTARDFPPTDLAIEMIYLNEAKSAVLQESHNLIKGYRELELQPRKKRLLIH